jgi:hypothetical protein
MTRQSESSRSDLQFTAPRIARSHHDHIATRLADQSDLIITFAITTNLPIDLSPTGDRPRRRFHGKFVVGFDYTREWFSTWTPFCCCHRTRQFNGSVVSRPLSPVSFFFLAKINLHTRVERENYELWLHSWRNAARMLMSCIVRIPSSSTTIIS